MNVDYLFTLLRAFLYFWLAVEFINTAWIYYYGYYRLKKSPIIKTMFLLFFVIGFYFMYLILVSLVTFFNLDKFQEIIKGVLIFIFPILFYIRKFKDDSLTSDDGKAIDEQVKKNKKTT